MGESIFTGGLGDWQMHLYARSRFYFWLAGTDTVDGTIIYQEPKLDAEGNPKLDSEGKPITVPRPISVVTILKLFTKCLKIGLSMSMEDVRFSITL